jgi:hypothetical protein
MKKVILVLALFAIAFTFSACSDSSLTGVDEQHQIAKMERPFKGNWEGMTYIISETGRLIDCQGNCTHLGLFEATVTYTVTYNAPPPYTTGGTIIDGEAEMIAANGDKVYLGNLTGNWMFNGLDPITGFPNSVYFDCVSDIVGGTGRFEGATGSFTGDGLQKFYATEPLRPQEISFTWSGTITY